MSKARTFLKGIGPEIADALGEEYRFYSSGLRLQRKRGSGHDIVILSGSNKYSPRISTSFYVGRLYDDAKQLEKALGVPSPPYHIQQYSPRAPKMAGLEYSGAHTWTIDIRSPPNSLVEEICAAIRGIGHPFFERFRDIDAARTALITGDSWCFPAGGHYWRTLFSIDAVTGNIDHFKTWMKDLDPLYRQPATERLEMLRQHIARAV